MSSTIRCIVGKHRVLCPCLDGASDDVQYERLSMASCRVRLFVFLCYIPVTRPYGGVPLVSAS